MEIRLLIICLFFNAVYAIEHKATSVLQAFLGEPLSSSVSIERLPGMTNENYLGSDNEYQKYVVRIPGFSTEQFIDRLAEFRNSHEAFKKQFNPAKCLFYDQTSGIKITEYIKNFKTLQFEDFYKREIIKKIAGFLRSIHQSDMLFTNEIKIFDRIESLAKILMNHSIELPSDYFIAKDGIEQLKKDFQLVFFEKRPCHGDPVPSNFMIFSNHLMLFDWEYSGLCDPAWDLAFLSSVMDYSQDLDCQLIKFYGGTYSETLHAKLAFFKPIVELWLGLWGLLQTTNQDDYLKKEFFRYFAIARFRKSQNYQNCKAMKKSPGDNS